MGVNATYEDSRESVKVMYGFQWAPTLGGECYSPARKIGTLEQQCFNGHPPLGVNATDLTRVVADFLWIEFQWAPTLGGECYLQALFWGGMFPCSFQWAPTLGGECYPRIPIAKTAEKFLRFNGHPPLGVNATRRPPALARIGVLSSFNGHPPLGVNATTTLAISTSTSTPSVSMGTHPWG